MNKYVLSLIVSLMLFSAAGAQSFSGILGATDPALAAAVRTALEKNLPATPAPSPVNKVKTANGPEYYAPLQRGAIYDYEYTSSEFAGVKILRLEFDAFSAKDSSVTVTKSVFSSNTRQTATFSIYLTNNGIQADGSPLAGPRLEMPSQVRYNQTWSEGQNQSRVAAVNTQIKTSAGDYTGCVRIITRIGGNGGTINRYYAPGVGLVAEQMLTKEKYEAISLVAYQLK